MTMTLDAPPALPSRAAWRDALAELAASQDDLVTSAQLRELGVPSSTASGRLRHGGTWSRVLPGVHLVSGGRPDRQQRERAALLYASPHGILAGVTALRRLGVRAGRLQEVSDDHRAPDPVHLMIPHEHHLLAAGFLQITRTRRWPEVQVVDGLRMVSTCRAIADTARQARSVREVAVLVEECVRTGLVAEDDLLAEMHAGPRQGSAHLRAVLLGRMDGAGVGLVDLVRAMVEAAGLPAPLWQPQLVGPAGEPVGSPLAWCEDVGLAIDAAAPDASWVARQQRYAQHGITVFPVTGFLLRADPGGQARILAGAAREASLRPRPRVRAASPGPDVPPR